MFADFEPNCHELFSPWFIYLFILLSCVVASSSSSSPFCPFICSLCPSSCWLFHTKFDKRKDVLIWKCLCTFFGSFLSSLSYLLMLVHHLLLPIVWNCVFSLLVPIRFYWCPHLLNLNSFVLSCSFSFDSNINFFSVFVSTCSYIAAYSCVYVSLLLIRSTSPLIAIGSFFVFESLCMYCKISAHAAATAPVVCYV